MQDKNTSDAASVYVELLKRYALSAEASVLLETTALGEGFVATGVTPMLIKEIHEAAVAELLDADDSIALVAAHRLLLEVLFAYGASYSALSERLLAAADAAELTRVADAESAEHGRLALLAG